MGNGFSVFCNQIDVEPKIIKIFPKKVKFNPNRHDQCVQYAEPLNNERDGDVNDNESDIINDDRWRNDVKDRIKGFYYDEDYLDKFNDDEFDHGLISVFNNSDNEPLTRPTKGLTGLFVFRNDFNRLEKTVDHHSL
ncbi:unnamed protein product [Trichobilharzia regenti]|nr:unnamed protein product [Trichobilharzia regenti]